MKKQIYEDLNLPRLWMIDPRYNNVEVYQQQRIRADAEGHPGGIGGAFRRSYCRSFR